MTDFFSRVSPGEMVPIITIAGGLIMAVVISLGGIWRSVKKAEIEARLKEDMLDRGMSAEEIRTVLEAGK